MNLFLIVLLIYRPGSFFKSPSLYNCSTADPAEAMKTVMVIFWLVAACHGLLAPRDLTGRISRASTTVGSDVIMAASPRELTSRGMQAFRTARSVSDVAVSRAFFDEVVAVNPSMAPYMWQRGLALFYENRFEEGAQQFRRDVAVNPNDTEEAVWAFLCEARLPGVGVEGARRNLLKVGRDPRPVMRAVYALYSGEATEKDLAKAGEADDASKFYAALYLGLFAEVGVRQRGHGGVACVASFATGYARDATAHLHVPSTRMANHARGRPWLRPGGRSHRPLAQIHR